MAELQGLVVDYGGVLTSPLSSVMGSWCESDGIDLDAFTDVMREWVLHPSPDGGDSPVLGLERGTLEPAAFERALAERLRTRDGQQVPAEGLLARMFGGFRPEPLMVGVLRRARAAGLRTGLLSNSWGMDYPREDWAELFDATVISGEVGLRKPDAEIYHLVAERLQLRPTSVVFVDDLVGNVRGAAAVGMVGVHHTDPAATVRELETLFGVPLG